MSYIHGSVATNLLNPATLSFCLGAFARLVRSELSVPRDVYAGISIFLLFSIGLKGGHELSMVPLTGIATPLLATCALGILTPLLSFWTVRWLGRLSIEDSAGIAAHYGSVSVVTFMAAQGFVSGIIASRPELPHLEGYLATLVALLETPGITVALLLGVFLSKKNSDRSTMSVMHEVVTGRSIFLLAGGMALGWIMGEQNWQSIAPLFDPKGAVFKGLLCIFLLEMGISAASRALDVRCAGLFLIAFGVVMPVVQASLAIVLGHMSGLSVGGTAVLAAMSASASYIAAPPAVRATLPDANPAYYLTLALAVTFPFNIIIGIPLYFQMSEWYFQHTV